MSSCGPIRLGSAVPNDLVGSGWTLEESGPLNASSGKEVEGTALVYRTEAGTYVVRLAGLKTPSENGLQVVFTADGTVKGRSALRAYSGNQNFEFTVSPTPFSFETVTIFSTASNTDYGIATLTP